MKLNQGLALLGLALSFSTIASANELFDIRAGGNSTSSGTISLRCNDATSSQCSVSGNWQSMQLGCSIACPTSKVRVFCDVGSSQLGTRRLEAIIVNGVDTGISTTIFAKDYNISGGASFACVYTD